MDETIEQYLARGGTITKVKTIKPREKKPRNISKITEHDNISLEEGLSTIDLDLIPKYLKISLGIK